MSIRIYVSGKNLKEGVHETSDSRSIKLDCDRLTGRFFHEIYTGHGAASVINRGPVGWRGQGLHITVVTMRITVTGLPELLKITSGEYKTKQGDQGEAEFKTRVCHDGIGDQGAAVIEHSCDISVRARTWDRVMELYRIILGGGAAAHEILRVDRGQLSLEMTVQMMGAPAPDPMAMY